MKTATKSISFTITGTWSSSSNQSIRQHKRESLDLRLSLALSVSKSNLLRKTLISRFTWMIWWNYQLISKSSDLLTRLNHRLTCTLHGLAEWITTWNLELIAFTTVLSVFRFCSFSCSQSSFAKLWSKESIRTLSASSKIRSSLIWDDKKGLDYPILMILSSEAWEERLRSPLILR